MQVTEGGARRAGKAGRDFFDRHISPFSGKLREDVLLGPKYGADFGVVSLGGGRVMAVSTDPIWVDRIYGLKRAAWFAFHTITGDVAVSGLRPTHIAVDWNLPHSTKPSEAAQMLSVFHAEAEKLGMSIIAGHTGHYEGASFPAVGGATAFAVGRGEDVRLPGSARPGDEVLMTKGAAIETAVAVCYRHPRAARTLIGRSAASAVRSMFGSLSVVDDALVASSLRSVSSMHDVSERGLAAALNEMAELCGHDIVMDGTSPVVPVPVKRLCSALSLDPLSCSSSGSLLVTVRSGSSDALIRTLSSKGIEAWRIGRIGKGDGGVFITGAGKRKRLDEPRSDGLVKGLEAAAKLEMEMDAA